MQIKVEVTQTDINNGCMNDTHRCPVANAITRAIGDSLQYLSVGAVNFSISRNFNYQEIEFPDFVTERIQKYDNTGEMEPFSFSFEIED